MNNTLDAGIVVKIKQELDIVSCRRAVRESAIKIGFGITDQTRIVTAASELARNIFQYAGSGRVLIIEITESLRKGLKLIFEDQGPGFELDEALLDGFSTSRGMGMGLPGSKRLMDEFEVHSVTGTGTTVTIVKWN